MTELELHTVPRPRHSSGRSAPPPLYVWPIVAMLAMLPVLVLLIVALVT
ncbi:MAG TPA: hypothetical protein VNR36_01170 [Pseudolysinimonas sp.]|nr:hypothetical protein [Pseudolysinimonas sp.]